MSTTERELLRCPFCGDTGAVVEANNRYVRCYGCDAYGPTGMSNVRAIKLWNRRTALDAAVPARPEPVGVVTKRVKRGLGGESVETIRPELYEAFKFLPPGTLLYAALPASPETPTLEEAVIEIWGGGAK